MNATVKSKPKLLSVAPMMAWTDTHCRFLHRLYTPSALLFTEMVTTDSLLRGGQWHQLDYGNNEHPIALQLGGNDPTELAQCAAKASQLGYDEINLNVGCPSDRVQRGTFGACLMREPQLVAECVRAMLDSCDIKVSVKCRLGVDDHDNNELLLEFVDVVATGGCNRFYLHARKAILSGLSPAQNRSVPPLQPARVRFIKQQRPQLEIIMNGGITSVAEAQEHLQWADGVMIGRAAYQRPEFLAQLERLLFDPCFAPTTEEVLNKYQIYVKQQLISGQRLHSMTRHLLNTCNGMPGARRFRQVLSDSKRLKKKDLGILEEAFAHVIAKAA